MPSIHPNCGLSLTSGRLSLCAFGGPYSCTRSRRRSSHPTTTRLLSTLDRSALDFFLLYHSQHGTEDGHYTGVYRYGSVPGHSRYVGVLEYRKGHLS